MTTILGIDPGTTNTGMAILRMEQGEPPRLLAAQTFYGLDRLQVEANDHSPVLRINRIIAYLRAVCLLHRPDLIGVEEFTYFDRNISAQAHDCYRLLGAIYTLADYAPVVCLQPSVWRRQLTGLPMPKKISVNGSSIRTGFEHQVRRAVYLRLDLNGGHDLTPHEVDALGVALAVGDRHQMAQAALVDVVELREKREGRKIQRTKGRS